MARGDFQEHIPRCPVMCPHGCGENVPRANLNNHATVCPNVQVPCAAAEFGCTETVLRGVRHNHEQQCRYEQSRFIFEPIHQDAVMLRKHESEIFSLTTKYNNLNKNHQQVLTEVGDTKIKYDNLHKLYKNALTEVGELKRNNENLSNKYNQACNDIGILRKQYTTLENKYESLESKYETILQRLVTLTTKSHIDQLPSTVSKSMDPIEHVACGGGCDIEIWNVSTGTRVKVLKGHRSYIWSVIQLSDGTLVSASSDSTIRLWNIETGECTKVHTGHTNDVKCVIQLANGTIASGSSDKRIRIWNREQEIKTIQAGTWVQCLLEVEDGTLVSGDDKMITFWNVRGGEKIKTLTGHTSAVRSLIQLKDGRLVSVSDDKTIRIWKNDKCEKVLEGHTHWVYKVIELTDGQLASCSQDNTIRLWNINTGECQVLTGHTDKVWSVVQISSNTIISGSLDKTIRVWKNGKQIKQTQCSEYVWSMAPIKMKT
jgi:WD40 repeat protein